MVATDIFQFSTAIAFKWICTQFYYGDFFPSVAVCWSVDGEDRLACKIFFYRLPFPKLMQYFWETSNHGGQGSYCRPRSEQDKFSCTTVEVDHAMRWCSVELISWSLKWKQIYLLVSEGVRSWPCWDKFVLVPAMMRVTFDNYHSIVVLMSIIGEGVTSLK